MTKTNAVSRRTTAALAIIVLLPALILFIMWSSIGVGVSGISGTEKINLYLGRFHGLLSSMTAIHAVSIVSCLLAIILATRSFSKHLLSVRLLMMLTVIVAFFILIFDVYQMV